MGSLSDKQDYQLAEDTRPAEEFQCQNFSYESYSWYSHAGASIGSILEYLGHHIKLEEKKIRDLEHRIESFDAFGQSYGPKLDIIREEIRSIPTYRLFGVDTCLSTDLSRTRRLKRSESALSAILSDRLRLRALTQAEIDTHKTQISYMKKEIENIEALRKHPTRASQLPTVAESD